jgi:hypothetical protein
MFDTVEARFDRRQIVAVPTGLLENMAGHHLLTLDLALDNGQARFRLGAAFAAPRR